MNKRNCQHCHTCGATLENCMDGEQYCPTCHQYMRYRSHGWGQQGDGEWYCPDVAQPHPMGCVCDTPDACVACTPEPDPDALDFSLLLKLGMTPQEAAEVKDFEYFDFEEWRQEREYAY